MLLKNTWLILFICYHVSINSMSLPSLIAGTPMVHTVMSHFSNSFDDYQLFTYRFEEAKIGPTSFSKDTMYLINGKINNNCLRSLFNACCLAVNLYFLYKSYTTNTSDIHKIYTFSAVMFHVVQLTTMPVKTKPLHIDTTE